MTDLVVPFPPPPNPAASPVVIAGMYHSGTSMLAECLHRQGVRMWTDEWGQVRDDKQVGKTFCECRRAWDINDAEMRRNPIKVYADRMGYNYTPTPQFRADLVQYRKAREVEANGQAWGVKEPRIATYVDGWLGAFRGSKMILCLRNPGRVAETRVNRGHGTNPLVTLVTYNFTVGRTLTLLNDEPQIDAFLWIYERTEAEHCAQQKALRAFLGMPEFDYMGSFKRER